MSVRNNSEVRKTHAQMFAVYRTRFMCVLPLTRQHPTGSRRGQLTCFLLQQARTVLCKPFGSDPHPTSNDIHCCSIRDGEIIPITDESGFKVLWFLRVPNTTVLRSYGLFEKPPKEKPLIEMLNFRFRPPKASSRTAQLRRIVEGFRLDFNYETAFEKLCRGGWIPPSCLTKSRKDAFKEHVSPSQRSI